MVSFWPWGRDDSSPASFEKTLSALSHKISDSQARLDRTRATSRRVRVLCTLYLSFAYLVYAIVEFLVVRHNNMGSLEWAGVAGGPLVIFVTRQLLSLYFNFRIESQSSRLKQYQDERAKTIQKLKDTTKYDSTLQLLEKYGGGGEGRNSKDMKKQKNDTSGDDGENEDAQKKQHQQQQVQRQQSSGRTTMAPPATANIQRPSGSPAAVGVHHFGPEGMKQAPPDLEPTAEFAPNAYSHPPPHTPVRGQQTQYSSQGPAVYSSNWYDKVLDLLLGEDETAPKNRIILLCQNCRLVNGQAPPGTKSMSEVGIWKCMSCGAQNGEMDEGKRIINEVLGSQEEASQNLSAGADFRSDDDEAADHRSVDVGQDQVTEQGHSTGKESSSGSRKRRNKKS